MDRTRPEQLHEKLTLHVGDEQALLERADSSSHLTELVLAPVEIHRRNIQRRLRESQTPKGNVQFAGPTEVGKTILDSAGLPATTIDRVDRLSMIRAVLSDDELSIRTPAVPADPQTVEQIRTEIENVTGFHPERLDILDNVVDDLATPIDADATEILNAATAIQRALRKRTSKSVSDVAFIRRSTRNILATDGEIWEDAFPDVECVSLVGVSSIPAGHIDLVHAVLHSVSVPVHIHLRQRTGSYLSRRVPRLFDVDDPGAVVFES